MPPSPPPPPQPSLVDSYYCTLLIPRPARALVHSLKTVLACRPYVPCWNLVNTTQPARRQPAGAPPLTGLPPRVPRAPRTTPGCTCGHASAPPTASRPCARVRTPSGGSIFLRSWARVIRGRLPVIGRPNADILHHGPPPAYAHGPGEEAPRVSLLASGELVVTPSP